MEATEKPCCSDDTVASGSSINCSNNEIKHFSFSLSSCSPPVLHHRRGVVLGKTFQGWVSTQLVPHGPWDPQHGQLWPKHQQVSVVRSVFYFLFKHIFPELWTIALFQTVSQQRIMLCFCFSSLPFLFRFLCQGPAGEREKKHLMLSGYKVVSRMHKQTNILCRDTLFLICIERIKLKYVQVSTTVQVLAAQTSSIHGHVYIYFRSQTWSVWMFFINNRNNTLSLLQCVRNIHKCVHHGFWRLFSVVQKSNIIM